ncbi:hypothetical protein EHS25_002311 [Saitozyma podzolica]|uniref:Major facilitator superfamily (MFS) profile domain-containing protein n=1 Tax=Saitozyma podzolica TaxID=1890683 RepID=A0A427YDF2_9TREE|nr:hypothetical protein EHS25_002311 [Saitozyma podzolica]
MSISTEKASLPDEEAAVAHNPEAPLGGAATEDKRDETATDPTEPTETGTQKDVIPDGGYGWVIVGAILASNAVTWGINTTYGVFSAYYLAYNYYQATTLDYAWVGGLSVACSLLCAPLANYLTRRFHFRLPMFMGAVCVSVGQCAAGVCKSFGPFLVCQGVIFGIGLGLTLIPAQPLLAHWFDRHLSLAQGIAACGSGLGGLILSNTTRVALEHLGVKWALIINGLISCVVLFPAICLMRGRHKAVGARSAPFQLNFLWHPGFLWVLLWSVFTMMAYFIALYSMASFATHALNFSQTQGAALQSILAAGQMVGRPIWGLALDRGGRINMTILCYILCGISTLAIWLPARSFGVLVFFAVVQGLTGGTIWSAATPVVARVVGVQDLASALSIFWLVLVIPALVGQPIAIALLDYSTTHLGRTGPESYFISIGLCGGMALFGAGLLYGAKRYLQQGWTLFRIV